MAKGSGIDLEAPVERAVLVYVNEDAEEDRYVEDELEGLCEAAGVEPAAWVRQRMQKPFRSTYVGSGKLEEIALLVKETEADLVLVDGEVSGVQQRNIQDSAHCRVVDRTQLILDIFARRARTKEGMLQVELAQLTTMLPKLMSVYTKFERQKGGIGMRGPGETKLETDRRMVRARIARLEDEISDVKQHRDQQRASRRKHPFPFASIVGYTSAGKSTLMNRMAGTELLADAMPFATLDPTTRKVDLPDGYGLFLTDTVGFIRSLPTELVAAFRATLEEVVFSDFLLHVVDISHPAWELQHAAVLETLEDLGAKDIPMITILNKADRVQDRLLPIGTSPSLDQALGTLPNAVAISALTGAGMDGLMAAIVRQVKELLGSVKALIPYANASLLEDCYRMGRVKKEEYREDGIYVEAELVSEMRGRMAPYLVP